MRPTTNASSMPLPNGFASIEAILDGHVNVGSKVKLMGVVKDCRMPIPTRRADWKMEATLFDLSTQDDSRDIRLSIFWPEDKMPTFMAGDVVLLHSIKIQHWSGNTGLITHHSTTIHVFDRTLIPRPPGDAAVALKRRPGDKTRALAAKEIEYASYLFHALDEDCLPSVEEFEEKKNQSLNVKQKFATLDMVSDGKFHDLVAQIVKDPYPVADQVTFWVTDYTTNNAFFDHGPDAGGVVGDDGRDGDPYGYTAKFRTGPTDASFWPGPYGKMSLQVSCWEPHASFLMSFVKAGNWVLLNNVQIKRGRNGQNLEGFLRGDLAIQRFKNEVGVTVLETDDPETTDPRAKEAIRRERDYKKKNKKRAGQASKGSLTTNGISKGSRVVSAGGGSGATAVAAPTAATNAVGAGIKRKGEEEQHISKSKRKREKRRAQAVIAERLEILKNGRPRDSSLLDLSLVSSLPASPNRLEEPHSLVLNPLVKCEAQSKEISALSGLLEPVYHMVTVHGGQSVRVKLPFNNAKYHTAVRVVDFSPSNLADFAVYRRKSKYAALSDDEDEESSDDCTDDNDSVQGAWEWCFALVLEDAVTTNAKAKAPDRVRVLVDNFEGQNLTDLDPGDLRANPELLGQLREKMSGLWGNLEEIKTAQEQRDGLDGIKKRLQAGLPPPCSDTEPNGQDGAVAAAELINQPFSCCIKQYGVKARTRDVGQADAGNGFKWTRTFSLFGTRIRSVA